MADRSIGVVIPLFNGERWIDACLASVAGQTVHPDAVVVVDDGSTDSSAERAERWASLLPLTVIRSATNGGVAAARNTGLAALSTHLVALLDADDVWLPDHVEVLSAVWAAHGGIATAQAMNWRPGEGLTPYHRKLRGNEVPPPVIQFERLLNYNFVFVGSLFERQAALDVGGFVGHGTEDWTMWLRLVDDGAVVTAGSHPTVLYRIRRSSLAGNTVYIQDEALRALVRLRDELPHRRIAIDAAIAQRECERTVAAVLAGEAPPSTARPIAMRGEIDWRIRSKAMAASVTPGLARRFLGGRARW
jgi:glycosyltransferase involved in cell wall biosynthesis